MKIEELKKQYDHKRYLKNREKILKRTRDWANFPDGFRVLCRNCNWKEYLRKKENKNEH